MIEKGREVMSYHCSQCGEPRILSTKSTVKSSWGAARFTFMDVPVEKCEKCGEIYISPAVAKKMQAIMKKRVQEAGGKISKKVVYA